ncbi:MAG: hypothetical protein HYS62_00780 [Candidatus Aenigmarchaeota archaeon]|nr:hypothetical protein [Candidatus Aenigmarchaeota archaeon]
MFALYGLLGLTLIIFSYLFSRLTPSAAHLNFLFALGYWLFFDAIDYSLSGTSILNKIKNNKILLFYLIISGALLGLVLDFYAILISKVWVYPTVTNLWSVIELYINWGLVLLIVYSSYRVWHYIIRKMFGMFGMELVGKSKEHIAFSLIGYTGILFLIIPFFLSLFYNVTSSVFSFGFAILGLWFISEFVEYTRKERSLIKDVIEGHWTPIISIIIGSIVTGITWELLNLPVKAWIYTNIPFSNLTLFGIPITIILGWPFLFVVYLSFYRAIFKGNDRVW